MSASLTADHATSGPQPPLIANDLPQALTRTMRDAPLPVRLGTVQGG